MSLGGQDMTGIHFRLGTFAFVSDLRVSAAAACSFPRCPRRCPESPCSKGRAADGKDLGLGSAVFCTCCVILDNDSLTEPPLPYPLNGYNILCLGKHCVNSQVLQECIAHNRGGQSPLHVLLSCAQRYQVSLAQGQFLFISWLEDKLLPFPWAIG